MHFVPFGDYIFSLVVGLCPFKCFFKIDPKHLLGYFAVFVFVAVLSSATTSLSYDHKFP